MKHLRWIFGTLWRPVQGFIHIAGIHGQDSSTEDTYLKTVILYFSVLNPKAIIVASQAPSSMMLTNLKILAIKSDKVPPGGTECHRSPAKKFKIQLC